MKAEKYSGIVREGVVFLYDAPPIPEGTAVIVTPIASERGTSHAVLAAVESHPHVAAEAVDDLERAIQAGKRPPARLRPFDSQSQSD